MTKTTTPSVAKLAAANKYLGNCCRWNSRLNKEPVSGVDLASLVFIKRTAVEFAQTLDGETRSLRGPGATGWSSGAGSAGTSSNPANSRRCAARAVCFSGSGDWRGTDDGARGGSVCQPRGGRHTPARAGPALRAGP